MYIVERERERMEKLYVLCSLVLFVGVFASTLRATSAVWLQAHATFYGGSDASGTMGELLLLNFDINVCMYRNYELRNIILEFHI